MRIQTGIPVSQVDRDIEKMLRELGVFEVEHLPSYIEFWEDTVPRDVYNTIYFAGGGHSNDTAGTMQRIYAQYLYHRSGQRTYSLKPEIAQALLDTDLPENKHST